MKKRISKKSVVLVLGILVLGLVLVGAVIAQGQSDKSESPVYWSWDIGGDPAGVSNIVRTKNGISAEYETYGLTPGNAVTMWFIVFNNPEECSADGGGCSPDDFANPLVAGDFLVASGHVIGDSGEATFAGHLKVGDTSGSGLAEMICLDGHCTPGEDPELTPGLIDPEGAMIIMGIHDHGPKLSGQVLKEQISSFLGGCDLPFIGDTNGFATGTDDLPNREGECSTIQFSPHPPKPNDE